MKLQARWFVLLIFSLMVSSAGAAEPLHTRIDALISAAAKGQSASARADDAEFLRRVYLDLTGHIPSVADTRAFLQDGAADKRTRLIDKLLAGPDYPRRMQELFNVMLMERLGDNDEWTRYLEQSFATNKPWDQLVREILRADPRSEATRGAAFFYAKRLEHYGENPVDYPALTRDVGRLFLGIDLQCAQCHDHRIIKDYKQQDFQGLLAFFQNTALVDLKKPAIGEKLMTQKLSFSSVFNKVKKETGPRLPGMAEIEIPAVKKGEEFLVPPENKTNFPGVPRFSPLAKLAEQLPQSENAAFTRNIVNRLWFVLMGRGLVHPLDMHHSANPPSHPELLDLLASEFVAHKWDIKWLLRELALSETYQRSSILPASGEGQPQSFLTALEKRLSAEQLLASMLEATGERERVLQGQQKSAGPSADALRKKFLKAFANPPRDPEERFNPSLKAALFVLNDEDVVQWFTPHPGNLVERLTKLNDDQAVEELYLATLTRLPSAAEKTAFSRYLTKNAGRRPTAPGHLAWALLASTEFSVNH